MVRTVLRGSTDAVAEIFHSQIPKMFNDALALLAVLFHQRDTNAALNSAISHSPSHVGYNSINVMTTWMSGISCFLSVFWSIIFGYWTPR